MQQPKQHTTSDPSSSSRSPQAGLWRTMPSVFLVSTSTVGATKLLLSVGQLVVSTATGSEHPSVPLWKCSTERQVGMVLHTLAALSTLSKAQRPGSTMPGQSKSPPSNTCAARNRLCARLSLQ